MTALRAKDVDLARVQARAPLAKQVDARPVDALVSASRDADLLVVGSRGLHGLRALGSVSERVAHQALCSVLVVRPR
jgi:nucleotide-binding universal stress UspA family protein